MLSHWRCLDSPDERSAGPAGLPRCPLPASLDTNPLPGGGPPPGEASKDEHPGEGKAGAVW